VPGPKRIQGSQVVCYGAVHRKNIAECLEERGRGPVISRSQVNELFDTVRIAARQLGDLAAAQGPPQQMGLLNAECIQKLVKIFGQHQAIIGLRWRIRPSVTASGIGNDAEIGV
jgi:hypothetical protein